VTPLTPEAALALWDAWLVTVSGLPAVQVYRFGSGQTSGTGDRIIYAMQSDTEASGPERVGGALQQARRLAVQVDAYGWTAADALMTAGVLAIADHPATRALNTAGVSVTQAGPVLDTTAIAGSDYETRRTWGVVLGYVRQVNAAPANAVGNVILGIQGRNAPTLNVNGTIPEPDP
jgi:hypothetical protein